MHGTLNFGTFSLVVLFFFSLFSCDDWWLQKFINEGMSDEIIMNWYSFWSQYSHNAFIYIYVHMLKNENLTTKKIVFVIKKRFILHFLLILQHAACNNEKAEKPQDFNLAVHLELKIVFNKHCSSHSVYFFGCYTHSRIIIRYNGHMKWFGKQNRIYGWTYCLYAQHNTQVAGIIVAWDCNQEKL